MPPREGIILIIQPVPTQRSLNSDGRKEVTTAPFSYCFFTVLRRRPLRAGIKPEPRYYALFWEPSVRATLAYDGCAFEKRLEPSAV
jgi:hypothetical protein